MTDLDATAELPAGVVFQAKNPSAAGPEPHPDSKAIRVLTDDYCILVTSMAGLTLWTSPYDSGPGRGDGRGGAPSHAGARTYEGRLVHGLGRAG